MSYQVMRVAKYTVGCLQNIGNELERSEGVEHRNSDIDVSRKELNHVYVSSENGFYRKFKKILKDANCSFAGRTNQIAFEGMIITSDTAFFESFGWERGKPAPRAVYEFFDRAYSWALSKIGYKGTDINIIGAQVHYDETTPHLQLYYVPIVNKWREKVYELDDAGKVRRNEKGSPIQARDENGKTISKIVENPDAPKVSHDDFWKERGGKTSYREMQDDFYETFTVGYGYHLDRGEVGSDRKHKTKQQYEAAEAKRKYDSSLRQIADAEQNLKEIHEKIIEEDITMKKYEEENEKLFQEQMCYECDNMQLQTKGELLDSRIKDLTKEKNRILAEIDELKTIKQEIIDEADEAIEKFTRAVNIPPMPPVPKPLPSYDEWCILHPLSEFVSYQLSRKKREEEQEKLRQKAYESEKKRFEEELELYSTWAAQWDFAEIAQKAIIERDREKTAAELAKNYQNNILRTLDKTRKKMKIREEEYTAEAAKKIEEKDKKINDLQDKIKELKRIIENYEIEIDRRKIKAK